MRAIADGSSAPQKPVGVETLYPDLPPDAWAASFPRSPLADAVAEFGVEVALRAFLRPPSESLRPWLFNAVARHHAVGTLPPVPMEQAATLALFADVALGLDTTQAVVERVVANLTAESAMALFLQSLEAGDRPPWKRLRREAAAFILAHFAQVCTADPYLLCRPRGPELAALHRELVAAMPDDGECYAAPKAVYDSAKADPEARLCGDLLRRLHINGPTSADDSAPALCSTAAGLIASIDRAFLAEVEQLPLTRWARERGFERFVTALHFGLHVYLQTVPLVGNLWRESREVAPAVALLRLLPARTVASELGWLLAVNRQPHDALAPLTAAVGVEPRWQLQHGGRDFDLYEFNRRYGYSIVATAGLRPRTHFERLCTVSTPAALERYLEHLTLEQLQGALREDGYAALRLAVGAGRTDLAAIILEHLGSEGDKGLRALSFCPKAFLGDWRLASRWAMTQDEVNREAFCAQTVRQFDEMMVP